MTNKPQKPLSRTRWKSQIESFKAIKFHVLETKPALRHLVETCDHSKAFRDVKGLCSDIMNF